MCIYLLRAFTWNQHENITSTPRVSEQRSVEPRWAKALPGWPKVPWLGWSLNLDPQWRSLSSNGYPLEKNGKVQASHPGMRGEPKPRSIEPCWDLVLVTSNAWVLWGWASAVPCYIEASTRQGEHLSWQAKLAKLVQHVEVTRAPCFTKTRFAVCRLRMLASLDNPTSCQGKELRFRKGHPQPAA